MSDLGAFVQFICVLDTSGTSPVIRLTDVSNYPGGVANQISGNFTAIVQPDKISIGNSNFGTPDIHWTGSGLSVASYALRLNTISQFQTGGYSITYQVNCPGYTNTVLTKTFNLSYTKPTVVIGSNFDVFSPKLTVTDNTVYSQANLNIASVADTWTAVVNSVNGSTQSIGGSGLTFDLNVAGVYYDAQYTITLTSIATWVIPAPGSFVTLIAPFTLTQVFDTETPPSLVSLLSSLTFLKAQMDAAICDCNTYPTLKDNYFMAGTVYQHLKNRGCNSDFSGLSSYVYQLQKIFNNNVTPPVAHTNLPIPAYDFGCATAGSISWSSITGKPTTTIIQWTVGQVGFPGAGTNSLNDVRLAGFAVLIMRNNEQELNFTKALASQSILFNTPFSASEQIYVQTIPI